MAFFRTINVRSMDNGFSRKSKAPSLVARTAVSMLPCPDIMMTSGWSSISTSFSNVPRAGKDNNYEHFCRRETDAKPGTLQRSQEGSTRGVLHIRPPHLPGLRVCANHEIDGEGSGIESIAFNPNNGVLFGASESGLYTIDPTTGQTS